MTAPLDTHSNTPSDTVTGNHRPVLQTGLPSYVGESFAEEEREILSQTRDCGEITRRPVRVRGPVEWRGPKHRHS